MPIVIIFRLNQRDLEVLLTRFVGGLGAQDSTLQFRHAEVVILAVVVVDMDVEGTFLEIHHYSGTLRDSWQFWKPHFDHIRVLLIKYELFKRDKSISRLYRLRCQWFDSQSSVDLD